MHTKTMVFVLLLAALVAFGSMGVATAQLAGKGRPTSVAVMDVERAFNAMKEKAQIEADLQVQTQKLQEEKTNREKELRQLQADLEILAPDTPAFVQKQSDLEQKAVELQSWAQFQTAKVNRERAVQIEGLYRKLSEGAGRVAKENGYDLVIFKEGAVNFRRANPEQLSALIQIRKLLWAADDLDITDLVLTTLNNEYVNRVK